MGKPRGYIICAVAGLALGAVGGLLGGYSWGARTMRVDAILSGNAQYTIVDEYGNTKFEWIPNPDAPKLPPLAPKPADGEEKSKSE